MTQDVSDAVAVVDIDGDGDLDVVRASSGGTSPPPFAATYFGNRYVWRNDGGGTWTVLFPFVGGPTINDTLQDIVAFDADGDGDVDVGFCQRNSVGDSWQNTGGGAFVAWPGLNFGGSPLEVCDLDHDGDLDLIGSWGWLENRGLGSFLGHALPGSLFSLRAIPMTLHAIGDVNADLQPDLVYGNYSPFSPDVRRVMLNQGSASDFVEAGARAWQSSLTSPLAIGDVDGDGFPDLVERSVIDGILWRNGGDGWFTAQPGPYVGQLVDLDGDGDLDGLGVTLPAVNDGTGAFTYRQPTPIAVPLSGIQGPLAFDADGDGDNDLVYFNATTLVLMRNNGAWVYVAATPVPLPTSGVTASAAADFDGDGDVDVLLGFQSPVAVGLLRNDGTGTFTLDPAGVVGITGNSPIGDLAVADIDGDGDRDVLAGRRLGTTPQHLVLRNNGGVLTVDPTALPPHTGPTQNVGVGAIVRLGDVDGDGDPDAVVLVVQSGAPDLHLWRNDGSGHFTFAEDLQLFYVDPVLLADIDLDGDADLFAGSRLFLSRQWHFEAPFLPQVGTTYVYRCASRALPNATAVTFLGTRITPVQVPFIGGALCIDPQTAIEIGSMTLNGEMAEGSVPVPLNPVLIGLTAAIQTVFLGVNGELHLAPAKHEIVRS